MRLEATMTEPVIVELGGTAPTFRQSGSAAPTYSGGGMSTVPGPVGRPPIPPARQADESDPVLAWLASDEARRYRNHWVALEPVTGSFLGLADSLADLRRWQAQDATVLFVDPEPETWPNG
jgi:hypothetical protein